MHHPPHFPPLPRLSPSNKKRADVEQRFNTPKGFISSNTPPTPYFFRQYPHFPPFSHLHTSAPYFPFPFSSDHAHPHFFRHFLICTFPPLTSRFPFHHTTPAPFFSRQSPPFPSSFSQLSLTFPLFCSFFFSIHSFPTPKIKKNPHQRKKNLIIKKKCCN